MMPPGSTAPGGGHHPESAAPRPNKILFAQGLPAATTSAMLSLLFQQYPGFIEVWLRGHPPHHPTTTTICCHTPHHCKHCPKNKLPPHTHFAKVRMVDARPGIAFVEFDSDLSSSTALAGLQGFKITPENAMELSFAKQ